MAQDQAAKQALARDQFEFEAAMALNKHALAEQIAAHGAALKTGQAMHGAALNEAPRMMQLSNAQRRPRTECS
jgi:hypothetical protein